MSLRTRILLFLFIFALVPLVMAVIINLPLVLERVDDFYRQNYMHDLRQDFRDLDQHLASRDANVRLLSRLPEPSLLASKQHVSQARVELDRARYTEWVNRILQDERDITEIRFLGRDAAERFWLTRDSRTHAWYAPSKHLPPLPEGQLAAIRSGKMKDVAYSPVRVRMDASDPQQVLTLQMMAPVRFKGSYRGAVVITIDLSGLVRRDPYTLWVLDDGSYLNLPGMQKRTGNAFDHYPGLHASFIKHKPALWERDGRRMIWVPLFVTESTRPLWVGRKVDTSPLREFRSELVDRVLIIIFGLIVLLLIAARMMAKRVEQISNELIKGIHATLEESRPVRFNWSDTRELKQLSADLTSLSQRHAVQAQRLAEHTRELEESNRYKSEFLANVSHELRTPLNSILLLSKLLGQSGLSGEQQEQARVIHKASNELKSLIDNILDLSKIEARQFDVHCEPVDLRAVLEDLRELMQPQFDQKGVALVVETEAQAPPVIRSDTDKVRQILKNFVANALKFTEEGEVWVQLRLAQVPYAVELAVSDTGIGIPKDKQAHIFDAFRQADGSTSRRYGGTGLGLTISRQLAQLLQGDIRLHSEPGNGATFTLLLPSSCDGERPSLATQQLTAEQNGPVERKAKDDLSESRLVGVQVMLLEADVRTQLRLSQLFQRWQVRPLLACDPEEARETLDEVGRLDVLLFDLRLLGERPCDTIRQLSEDCADDALFLGIGSEGELDCDPRVKVQWLDRSPEPETLHRILTEWETIREKG